MIFLNKSLTSPDINSKVLATLAILFFVSSLGLGGYLAAYEEDKIDKDHFTISQSLAYGTKEIMIPLYVLSFICLFLLNSVRGGDRNLLYFRYLMITITYSLLIVIMFVTVEKNKALHYEFAGTIFLSQLLFIFSIAYIFNNYLETTSNLLIPLDFNVILVVCAFILLLLFGIYNEDDTYEFKTIVFASSENATVILNLIPIFYLGFI